MKGRADSLPEACDSEPIFVDKAGSAQINQQRSGTSGSILQLTTASLLPPSQAINDTTCELLTCHSNPVS